MCIIQQVNMPLIRAGQLTKNLQPQEGEPAGAVGRKYLGSYLLCPPDCLKYPALYANYRRIYTAGYYVKRQKTFYKKATVPGVLLE
jgi:hypothetical protein